jgi:hypothetical protein
VGYSICPLYVTRFSALSTQGYFQGILAEPGLLIVSLF